MICDNPSICYIDVSSAELITWIKKQKTKQKNSEIYNWAGLNLWIYFINVSLKVYLFSRWSLTNQKSIKDLNFFPRIKLYLGTIKTDALDIFYSFYKGLIKYLPESSHKVRIQTQAKLKISTVTL